MTNNILSYSSLRDYKKDTNYFYEKHILKIIDNKSTDAMLVGSLVDCILTEGIDKLKDKYQFVERRNKNNTSDKTQVLMSMGRKAAKIAKAVSGTKSYKSIRNHQKQVKLFLERNFGRFRGICGILDFLYIEKNTAYITDLKTTNNLRNYQYKIKDYDYCMQMAIYKWLVEENFKEVKQVECRHLVCEIDSLGIYKCRPFKFGGETLARASVELSELLTKISKENFDSYKRNEEDFDYCEIV